MQTTPSGDQDNLSSICQVSGLASSISEETAAPDNLSAMMKNVVIVVPDVTFYNHSGDRPIDPEQASG